MDYKEILDLTKTQIGTVTDYPVVYVYDNYEPELRKPWIRVALLPSESNNVSQGIDSILEHNGLIQIDLFTPTNTIINFETVNTIVKVLNEQRFIGDLTLDRVWRGTDAIEDQWIRTPVFARFRYYQHNVGIND